MFLKLTNRNSKPLFIEKRTCPIHSQYRDYEDYLNEKMGLVKIYVAFVMLLISLFVFNINLNLNWLYSFMGKSL